jgi:hypothetical protein
MERLPRAFGAVLSAVLLLAMALPALCGKCQDPSAHSDCAEDHGGKTKQPDASSHGFTDCNHCDDRLGISANRQMQPGGPELVIFLRDSDSTPRHRSNRVAGTFATSPTHSLDGVVQKYVSAGETPLPKSVYRPLTVSLKI